MKYYVVLRTGRGAEPELVYITGSGEANKITLFKDVAERTADQLTKIYGSAFLYTVCELGAKE